jgi:hypothetical protein
MWLAMMHARMLPTNLTDWHGMLIGSTWCDIHINDRHLGKCCREMHCSDHAAEVFITRYRYEGIL